MNNQNQINAQIIESLRNGLPPQRGTDLYTVGNEKLIEGIKKFHLTGIAERGIIRFLNGSWGAGKTHFFRLLRDVTFQHDCLVSNVELNVSDASLNKFEKVFYSIIRNITTPIYYSEHSVAGTAPFGDVLRESLAFLGSGERSRPDGVTYTEYSTAVETLFADSSIDIDFKKMIQKYWETFLPEAPDLAAQEQTRSEILQWFSGEGTAGSYRKRFDVNKTVNKDNAKLMLQSLAGFVRLAGYRGLVILFDEAEQAYSIMRKSALRDAQNNLLSLINNIESLAGLFLIYATTPDFFDDPKHGIVIYGALAGRIGKRENHAPRALDTIWNFDEIETGLAEYQAAAKKIRGIYAAALPESASSLPSESDVESFIARLESNHPSLSPVRFWRVMVTGLIAHFDDHLYDEVRPADELYDDIMDRLRAE
jgi:hypothetical protein